MQHKQISAAPIATFLRMIPDSPAPLVASRFANGSIPVRGAQYCDAITSASSYGWWLYPPISFKLIWDGKSIYWKYNNLEWMLLSSVQFPHFASHFDAIVPTDIRGFSPPFLTVLPETGVIQLWLGYLMKTIPDWGILLRSPVNIPSNGLYELYEGIVETDIWTGPVFVNIRLNRTHHEIDFSRSLPIVQIQPLHRSVYSSETLSAIETVDMVEFAPEHWNGFRRDVVEPSQREVCEPGSYAKRARRRRKQGGCPFL